MEQSQQGWYFDHTGNQAESSSSSNPNKGYRRHPDNKNSVSILQEFYAKDGIIPKYDLISTASNGDSFKYEVTVGSQVATGSGFNKREAKAKAAQALLNRLDQRELSRFEQFPQRPFKERPFKERPPKGLKGREIGLYFAHKQKMKKANHRDFIDISNEQLKQVENISRLLDENALDFKDDAFFGAIDYESEFMKSYLGNLDVNAASSKKKDFETEDVDSWEMLEEAPKETLAKESVEPSRSKYTSTF